VWDTLTRNENSKRPEIDRSQVKCVASVGVLLGQLSSKSVNWVFFSLVKRGSTTFNSAPHQNDYSPSTSVVTRACDHPARRNTDTVGTLRHTKVLGFSPVWSFFGSCAIPPIILSVFAAWWGDAIQFYRSARVVVKRQHLLQE